MALNQAAIEEAEEETRRRVAQDMFERDKKIAEEKAQRLQEGQFLKIAVCTVASTIVFHH